MAVKLTVIICLTLASVCYIQGAPSSLPKEKRDLVEAFVEFINEDKELSAALEKLDFEHNAPIRNRRQVDDTEMTEAVDIDGNETPLEQEKPGFIDRVLVFAMELLQRFLKWINTDN